MSFRYPFSNIQALFFCAMLVCFPTLFAQSLTLESQLQTPGTFRTDVWGYVDPVSGIEYAIIGDGSGAGITIVDVSNPETVVQISNLNTVAGFDVKVWQHYVYTVTGGSGGTGSIVDISDPANPQVVGTFPSTHNIFISDNGFLIREGNNAFDILDLNSDPTTPQLVWNGAPGGHDAAVINNRLYDFHGTSGTRIFDFINPANPVLLGAIADPTINYHHSGWVTDDGQFLFICDELAQHPTPDITVWDISDLSNPQRVGEFSDPNAIVHNLYVIDDYAYVSYYTAGFRIFDISDPANISIAAEFDTSPETGESFAGAFGVYPFLPSGTILLSDWQGGLFTFTFSELNPTGLPGNNKPETFALAQNFPNPFNPSTTIRYALPENTFVNLQIFNVLGQPVRTLVNREQSPGNQSVEWDGKNDRGQKVSSGIYFYRIAARAPSTGSGPRFVRTKRMVLLR